MIDFNLSKDLDLQFDENGDFVPLDDIETAIITALFTDKRSNARRGHFALEFFEGSKLWLADQARITTNLLVEVRQYVTKTLEFLIKDDYVINYNVDVKVSGNSTLEIIVKLQKINGTLVTRRYEL